MSVPRQNTICYWSACQSSEHDPRGKGRKKTRNCKTTGNILLYKSLITFVSITGVRPSHRMPLPAATRLQGAPEPMQMSLQLRFTRSLSLWAPFLRIHYYDLELLERRTDSDTGGSSQTHPFLPTPITGQVLPKTWSCTSSAGTNGQPSTNSSTLHCSQDVLVGVSHTYFFPF